MAGKGSLRYDHPLNLGAIGATGTLAANRIARDADLVIGIGTRYSDFTTAIARPPSRIPDVRFININVTEFDAHKHHGAAGGRRCAGHAGRIAARCSSGYARRCRPISAEAQRLHDEWDAEVERIYDIRNTPLPSQGELIGADQRAGRPEWRSWSTPPAACRATCTSCGARATPRTIHLEYGNSCMGYEIAGGLGVKMAAPERDVYVIVGDGSYLMLSPEIVTSVQEGIKLIIVILGQQRLQEHRLAQPLAGAGRLWHALCQAGERPAAWRRREG